MTQLENLTTCYITLSYASFSSFLFCLILLVYILEQFQTVDELVDFICVRFVWRLLFFPFVHPMVAVIYSPQAHVPPLKQFEMDMNPLTGWYNGLVLSLPY